MKRSAQWLLGGAALLTGCQSPATRNPTATAATAAPALPASLVDVAPVAKPVAAPAAAAGVAATAETLTPEMLALLQKYDFAPLLQMKREEGVRPNDGFFGADHHRIEVVLTEVRRDSARPERYYLRGKDRCKGVITPFAGTLTLTQVVDQPRHTAQDRAELVEMGLEGAQLAEYMADAPNLYTALGRFEVAEDSARRGAGTFRGQLALDFKIDPYAGTVERQSQTRHTLTEEGTSSTKALGRTPPAEPSPLCGLRTFSGLQGAAKCSASLPSASATLTSTPNTPSWAGAATGKTTNGGPPPIWPSAPVSERRGTGPAGCRELVSRVLSVAYFSTFIP